MMNWIKIPRSLPSGVLKAFTLIEALLSIVLLALTAGVVSGLYISAAQTSTFTDDHVLLEKHLASRMEELVSRKFDQLSDGSEAITVGGQNYTLSWTATPIDLDGDSVAEPTAKQITVTLDQLALTAIVVDTEGRVGKI